MDPLLEGKTRQSATQWLRAKIYPLVNGLLPFPDAFEGGTQLQLLQRGR